MGDENFFTMTKPHTIKLAGINPRVQARAKICFGDADEVPCADNKLVRTTPR